VGCILCTRTQQLPACPGQRGRRISCSAEIQIQGHETPHTTENEGTQVGDRAPKTSIDGGR